MTACCWATPTFCPLVVWQLNVTSSMGQNPSSRPSLMIHQMKRKLDIWITHQIVSKKGYILHCTCFHIIFSQRKITLKLGLVSVADQDGKITDFLNILEESLFKIVPRPVRKLKDAQPLNCPRKIRTVSVVSCLVTKILFRRLRSPWPGPATSWVKPHLTRRTRRS